MRLPFRFHGTARPTVEPTLIQRAILSAELGLDTFETQSKFARIDEFLVQKPVKRARMTRKRTEKIEESVEVSQSVDEDSDVRFDDDAVVDNEVQAEDVKLSLLERCSTSNDNQGICSICEEEIRDGLFAFSLACAHSFCSECWLQHVQLSIKEERGVAGCMEPNCIQLLTSEAAESLLLSESAEIYRRFVEDASTSLRKLRCPECSRDVEYTGFRSAECQCGTVLCSSCSAIDHHPVSCHVYKQYRAARDGKDSSEDHWYPLLKNLSKCPYCGAYAEKGEGCSYIQCICNKGYCYICSRPWESNHKSKCNRRRFKVRLIDVAPPPTPEPVTPALINRTLAVRELIAGRRRELTKRMAILSKHEATETLKDIGELTHLLELAVLSSEWSDKSRRAESRIRMAFFAFANTSDGNVVCLRGKCAQLRQRVAEIRKLF